MNWAKLDASLAAAVEAPGATTRVEGADEPAGQRWFTLFVHLESLEVPADRAELRRFGIVVPDRLGRPGEGAQREEICTVRVPAEAVPSLSEQPWVRRLRLSSPLGLLDDP